MIHFGGGAEGGGTGLFTGRAGNRDRTLTFEASLDGIEAAIAAIAERFRVPT